MVIEKCCGDTNTCQHHIEIYRNGLLFCVSHFRCSLQRGVLGTMGPAQKLGSLGKHSKATLAPGMLWLACVPPAQATGAWIVQKESVM